MTPMWKISTGKIYNFTKIRHCPFTVRETSKRVISIPVTGTVNMKLKAQHLPEYQALKYPKLLNSQNMTGFYKLKLNTQTQ